MPALVSLSHFWSTFPSEGVLYEDADVIVIDKPVNTSTHAPDAVRATGQSVPGRSRPLCPYPQYAAYKGSGDPQDAANFTCRK